MECVGENESQGGKGEYTSEKGGRMVRRPTKRAVTQEGDMFDDSGHAGHQELVKGLQEEAMAV